MPYKSLQDFVNTLEKEGELIRIKSFFNPELEITEVTDRISKSKKYNKALLFENTGTEFPLLINAYGSYKRMCIALGVNNLETLSVRIAKLFNDFLQNKNSFIDKLKIIPKLGKLSSYLPRTKKSKAQCQEIIYHNPDLNILPVMKCWPYDGGKFITLPIVHTKDPETGVRNVGMYRMQIFDKQKTAMHWHLHKVSASHFRKYKQLNKIMPVAVALGGDPVYTYVATAPLPPNIDEYIFASFIRQKPVELVKCITQDIEVPADADIVIEGYIDPNEKMLYEGPFGDHTGFYSLADYYPAFNVTCITHKKNAIYPSTIVGIPPQEDAWIGKTTERIFINPIKYSILPEMIDMDMPVEGVFHNITIVKIKKEYPAHALKVMNSLWGAGQMMFNKILIITGEKTDIHNYKLLAKKIINTINLEQDIFISKGPMDILDHSSQKFAFGGKICIDITNDRKDNFKYNSTFSDDIFKNFKNKYKQVKDINISLLKDNINAVIISIYKKNIKHSTMKEFAKEISKEPEFKKIKLLFFVDYMWDINNIKDMVWLISNNIDPSRDIYKFNFDEDTICPKLVIDGTRKTKEFDNFNRDWPNIIVSDEETIKKIDKKWKETGIKDFIKSPSLKYSKCIFGNGAIATEL